MTSERRWRGGGGGLSAPRQGGGGGGGGGRGGCQHQEASGNKRLEMRNSEEKRNRPKLAVAANNAQCNTNELEKKIVTLSPTNLLQIVNEIKKKQQKPPQVIHTRNF